MQRIERSKDPDELQAAVQALHRLQVLDHGQDAKQAAAVAARERALSDLARHEITGEGDPNEARERLAAAEEEVLVNGRYRKVLGEELALAKERRNRLQAAQDAALRARYEPLLRKRRPQLEQAALDACVELAACIHLLEGVPAGFVSPEVVVKKLAGAQANATLTSFAARVEAKAQAFKEQS